MSCWPGAAKSSGRYSLTWLWECYSHEWAESGAAQLVKTSGVVLGAGLLLAGCTVKFGAAATTSNDRITIATLTTEVTNLNHAVQMYPSTVQLSSTQQTQETLTWLVRFQINDELAQQGVTVTPAQAEAALAQIYAAAKANAEAQGLSDVTLDLILAANGIPPNLSARSASTRPSRTSTSDRSTAESYPPRRRRRRLPPPSSSMPSAWRPRPW